MSFPAGLSSGNEVPDDRWGRLDVGVFGSRTSGSHSSSWPADGDRDGRFHGPVWESSTEAAATIIVDKATSDKFDYNGLKDRVLLSPANMYCISTSYSIHPAVWKTLDDGDKGCMTSWIGP